MPLMVPSARLISSSSQDGLGSREMEVTVSAGLCKRNFKLMKNGRPWVTIAGGTSEGVAEEDVVDEAVVEAGTSVKFAHEEATDEIGYKEELGIRCVVDICNSKLSSVDEEVDSARDLLEAAIVAELIVSAQNTEEVAAEADGE